MNQVMLLIVVVHTVSLTGVTALVLCRLWSLSVQLWRTQWCCWTVDKADVIFSRKQEFTCTGL